MMLIGEMKGVVWMTDNDPVFLFQHNARLSVFHHFAKNAAMRIGAEVTKECHRLGWAGQPMTEDANGARTSRWACHA